MKKQEIKELMRVNKTKVNSRRIYLDKMKEEARKAYCYDYARQILRDKIGDLNYSIKKMGRYLGREYNKDSINELKSAIEKLRED